MADDWEYGGDQVKTLLVRWSAITRVIGLFALLASGCAVTDGYGYGSVGIGVDYYEPFGVYYGGWGPDYRVGPFRDGGHRPDGAGGRTFSHAYRSAPASHAMPSIPSRFGGARQH